jgi:hypothetical protein
VPALWTRTSYTVTQAVSRIQGDLALANTNFLTSGNCLNWLNESQMILARDSQAFVVTTFIPTVSGTSEYALPSANDGAGNYYFISIQEAGYRASTAASGTTYRPLFDLSVNQLYAYHPRWRDAPASQPWAYYQRGMSSIGLYPAPSVSGTTDLRVTGAVVPPDAVSGTDTFYVPIGMQDAPLVYAKLQASLKDAYGEGRDRIPVYREEWQAAKRRCQQIVQEALTGEIVRMGENALLFGYGPRYGILWDPTAVATPLGS